MSMQRPINPELGRVLPEAGDAANQQEIPSANNPEPNVALDASSSMPEDEDRIIVPYRNSGDLLDAKTRIWESLSNKMLPPEETDLMIKRLEKKGDIRTRRTYVEGIAGPEVIESAPVLRVGLIFLPGADKPQVTRDEQRALQSAAPYQKSAMWRLNTAGPLLSNFDITADLSIKTTDMTQSISKRARRRLHKESGSAKPQFQQLTLREWKDKAVTIDSEHVEIVEDLRGCDWDLQATLIEVDGTSLLGLTTNYRHMISRGGPNMSFDETRGLLDTMIEDARRLCTRSPILFRMSTRTRIINSKNTRYGIDHGSHFTTISTSKGIQEIIRLSVSYYDALDPEGSTDTNQQFIRPKFLQMLVLLLSFLNDDDLEDIADLLQSTYKIKADRFHLEMLFLKIIPLRSINSKIFLEALVPAVEGFPLEKPVQDGKKSSKIWNLFVQRIVHRGYLLPGGVKDLGRKQNSWTVNWPDDGFKSTEVFRHLQYSGCRLKAINEIPRMDLHPEKCLKELTVHMMDGGQYIIDSRHLEKMTKMKAGIYNLVEARHGGRQSQLEVHESDLTTHLDSAIAIINSIIDEINRLLAAPKQKKIFRVSRPLAMLANFHGSGRITRHSAQLNGKKIAVAFKVEGRKITRRDVWRNITSTIQSVQVLQKELEHRAGSVLKVNEQRMLRKELVGTGKLLHQASKQCDRIGIERDLPDEPIVQVIYPSGDGIGMPPVWHHYTARNYAPKGLHLEAKVAEVHNVFWRHDGLADVELVGSADHYLASPVGQGEIIPDDEIRAGDTAILAGHYLIVGEQEGANRPLFATNFLRIASTQKQIRSNRGRLRATQAEEDNSEIIFA